MTFGIEMRRWAGMLLAVTACVYASGAAAQWAWKEESGRVVYSDRPPPPGVKLTQILRQPANPPSAVPTPAADGATTGDAKGPATGPKTVAERDMEFRKRQQERGDGERKAQEEQQKSAAKAENCERARGHLRSLEDGVRIARTDAAGNREFLDDAQRATEIERTRKIIQSSCN